MTQTWSIRSARAAAGRRGCRMGRRGSRRSGIAVRVPAALLKGNPALWSYAALMLAPKDGGGFTITDYIAEEIANGYIYAVRPGKK